MADPRYLVWLLITVHDTAFLSRRPRPRALRAGLGALPPGQSRQEEIMLEMDEDGVLRCAEPQQVLRGRVPDARPLPLL